MDNGTAAALGAFTVAVLSALVGAYIKIMDSRHSKQQELHGGTIEEYRELLNRLEKAYEGRGQEIVRLRERKDLVSERLTDCYTNFSRAEERIMALEERLEAGGAKIRKWISPKWSALPEDSAGSVDVVRDE